MELIKIQCGCFYIHRLYCWIEGYLNAGMLKTLLTLEFQWSLVITGFYWTGEEENKRMFCSFFKKKKTLWLLDMHMTS